jgi:hypothetical protein
MTNVNCNLCGAVNNVADEVCKVCGAELQSQSHYREPNSPLDSDNQSTFRPSLNVIPPFDGAGDVIGPTFSLFFKNLWMITKIVFVIVAPFEVFKVLSMRGIEGDPQLMVGIIALQLLCNALIVPALFYSLVQVMETGIAPGANEAYRWGLSKIPKLSLSAVLSWILIVLGTLLCIIPGIILGLAFHVVYPVAVFEQGSAIDVLKRSYKLTEGRRLSIFGAGIVIAIVMSVVTLPAQAGVAILTVNKVDSVPLLIAASIYTDIAAEITTVFSLVVYLSILRALGQTRSVIE